MIAKDYRNKGIGTKLMILLADIGKKMGLRMLVLSVFATNPQAFHVYQKVGYQQVARIPQMYYRHGEYVDEIRMAKFL